MALTASGQHSSHQQRAAYSLAWGRPSSGGCSSRGQRRLADRSDRHESASTWRSRGSRDDEAEDGCRFEAEAAVDRQEFEGTAGVNVCKIAIVTMGVCRVVG